MLTPLELLQLQLSGLHRIAQQEDAHHRHEIRADVQRRWPMVQAFIDQIYEQRVVA